MKSFNTHDLSRNAFQLKGPLAKKGYDWWWHSFTAKNAKTGKEKAFFIEYFLCNPSLAEKTPVLGQLEENKSAGKKPSYLMVKAGTWGKNACQLHKFYSWKDIHVSKETPYNITAKDCSASETILNGSINLSQEEVDAHPEYMCQAGSMQWNLTLNKKIAFNVGYGASKLFRKLNAFEMYWHAEGIKTEYSGTIIFNGDKYIVEPHTSFGYADKNWGSNFTSPWVWLASNNLTSTITGKKLANSAFDIGGGRPKAFGIPFERKLLSAFWYEGTPYEFNFSKFWTFCKTKFDCHEDDTKIYWHVTQETTKAIMDVEITCLKKDMLLVNYESPDGLKKHNRLWNGGNGTGKIKLSKKKGSKVELIDQMTCANVGCEFGEYDEK